MGFKGNEVVHPLAYMHSPARSSLCPCALSLIRLSVIGTVEGRVIVACKLKMHSVMKIGRRRHDEVETQHRFQGIHGMTKIVCHGYGDVEESSRAVRPSQGARRLVRARSLDMTRLLALVAHALARCLRRAVSREMTGFATVVAFLSLCAIARHVTIPTTGVAGLSATATAPPPQPQGGRTGAQKEKTPLAKEHSRLGELLLQALLRLDAISAEGEWEEARRERKGAVREVQALLDRLDGGWRARKVS